MNQLTNYLSLAFLATLLVVITSCDISNSGSDGTSEVTVKMKVNSSTNNAKKTFSTNPTTQAVDSLTEIKMIVEELELESVNDDSLDFEVDNLIINLPLDGSEIELASASVPTGIYDEFEMEIEYNDDSNINDPDFIKESGDDDDGYSLVIKGVYNGEEFTYRSDEDFEIEMEFNPPLEITESSSPAIAINIDPSGWFKDSSGNDLDPNDPANREKIDENIENSFEAEDDDGDDDDDSDDDEDSDD